MTVEVYGDRLKIATRGEVAKCFQVELIHDLAAIQEVVALEAAAFAGEGEDVFTIAAVAKVGWIWGVRDNDRLIGAVELLRQREPDRGFIHGVVIRPEHQYNGLGTGLIKYAESQAAWHGIEQIECTIAPTNGSSLTAFINNCGYRGNAFLPDCYGVGGHRLWVGRDLAVEASQYDHSAMVALQQNGEDVRFLEDDNYGELAHLLSDGNMEVVGILRKSPEDGREKNLLCVTSLGVRVE